MTMEQAVAAEQSSDVREFRIQRKFAATPEKVFAAWTDPGLIVGWFGPEGMGVPEVEIDLRVGGAWRTVMENDEGGQHVVGGVYREIELPSRLAMTWAWVNDGVEGQQTLIEIDFEADGEGTLMHFRHSGFDSQESSSMHGQGWESTWKCLEGFIAEGGLR